MTSSARGPGRRLVWWAALIRGSPGSWAADFCVEAPPGSMSVALRLSWRRSPSMRVAGAERSAAPQPNENRRAGSRRGPTPSMRGAGSWRRSPLDAVRRESSKQWVAAWSRPTPTRPGSNSYAIAATSILISLLNVPEARLRGVGLHARAQDVVQCTDRRLGIFLAVLERHASIEQPVVPC